MEHLPDYGAVVRQFQRLLKPGGKIISGCQFVPGKVFKPTLFHVYVFPGNHRYFVLHEFLSRVAKTSLEVQRVYNDRHSYYLTCREWAKNLESACQEITKLCSTKQCSTKRWSKKQSEKLYRIFRLYLWGSSYAFYSRSMDAFRVVMERPEDSGA